MTIARGGRHGETAARLAAALVAYALRNRNGRVFGAGTGFALGPDSVLTADAAFVSSSRLPGGEVPEGFVPLAPDLVIQIMAPDGRWKEARKNAELFLNAGSRLVWVVDPRLREVRVLRESVPATILDDEDTLDGADAAPGFSTPVSMLFESAEVGNQ